MTAQLCSEVNSSFSNAFDLEIFFDAKQRSKIGKFQKAEQPPVGNVATGCATNLYFGFFFDGTKNNYVKAEESKTHSNIVRLYDCYPGWSVPDVLPTTTNWEYQPPRYTHFYRTYIPGVSSPFKEVNDTGAGVDDTGGAATGYLGQARIVWALLQAINNVHRYFLKVPLVLPQEASSLARTIILNKARRQAMAPPGLVGTIVLGTTADDGTRLAFEKILKKLHSAVSQHWPDKQTGRTAKTDPGIVKKIHISIFGFSRGATQARAFTNWLMSLCKLDAHLCGKPGAMTLGGFEVVVDFLGIFDTVASVGLGNTLGNSMPGKLFNGHFAWADAEDSLRIPENIPCLHLVAAHELRRSFPLDSVSIKGVTPANSTEIVFPGVHSDVGCGYASGEQGRGINADGSDMLTRIPLLVMYQAARLAGVPLKLELASEVAKKRFLVTPETITAFNAYVSACQTKTGSLTAIMREQGNYQMQWRLLRRAEGKEPLEATKSYERACMFDKNDLHSANLEFESEIKKFDLWLKNRGTRFKPAAQDPGFDNDHENEWEEIARWWKAPPQLASAITTLFDDYVHDSRAWFKLFQRDPDNEKDLVKKLKSWEAQRVKTESENAALENRVTQYNQEAKKKGLFAQNLPYNPAPDGLTDNQREAAKKYALTGKIPPMITSGREPFESTSSSYFLSARGGYLRYRKIYGGWDSVLISETEPVQEQAKNVA